MTGIILHHYDVSPFSEKVRLLFGLKGLEWRSVIQPVIMPKPDLIPLTGGYRRIPVMQVGADVFCDSQIILFEIEQRAPEPKALLGPSFAINLWADRLFFQTTIPVIFGKIGGTLPKEFIEDREKLSGAPFDVERLKAMSMPAKGQWRAQTQWLEQALATSGGDFLFGKTPSIGDFSAYMNLWFLAGTQPDAVETLTAGQERVKRWRARVAAIGHGKRIESTPAEALAAAKAAEPSVPVAHDANDPSGLAPGARVVVTPDDYGREPIEGRLVGLNSERLAIDRADPALGNIRVHFPRAGYIVSAR